MNTNPKLCTVPDFPVDKVRRVYGWIVLVQVECHLLHEPLEGLALQLLT